MTEPIYRSSGRAARQLADRDDEQQRLIDEQQRRIEQLEALQRQRQRQDPIAAEHAHSRPAQFSAGIPLDSGLDLRPGFTQTSFQYSPDAPRPDPNRREELWDLMPHGSGRKLMSGSQAPQRSEPVPRRRESWNGVISRG